MNETSQVHGAWLDVAHLRERAFKNQTPHDGILMRLAAEEIERLRKCLSEAHSKRLLRMDPDGTVHQVSCERCAENSAYTIQLREALSDLFDAPNDVGTLDRAAALLATSSDRAGTSVREAALQDLTNFDQAHGLDMELTVQEHEYLSGHASDCAVHNRPSYAPGPCDCGARNSSFNVTKEKS